MSQIYTANLYWTKVGFWPNHDHY